MAVLGFAHRLFFVTPFLFSIYGTEDTKILRREYSIKTAYPSKAPTEKPAFVPAAEMKGSRYRPVLGVIPGSNAAMCWPSSGTTLSRHTTEKRRKLPGKK